MNPSAEFIHWPAAPAQLRLAEGEVHVWAGALAVSADVLGNLSAALSDSEKERAGKFKFDLHRNRFMAGRGRLRAILGRYFQAGPEQFAFTYSPQGKPMLPEEVNHLGIHFNVAHSEDLALFAVTRAGPVGIDVESVREMKNAEELVARFFSPRENELFQRLLPGEKSPAFFNLWTRKEALLKATGEGIAGGLNRVEVSFLPDEPARLLAISGDSAKAGQWSLRALSPASGFVGAVAIQTPTVHIRCWT